MALNGLVSGESGRSGSVSRRGFIGSVAVSVGSGGLAGSVDAGTTGFFRQVTSGDSWTFHAYDPAGTRTASDVSPPSNVTATAWSLGELPASPAVVADGTVYFGTEAGVVNAVDGTTGSKLWSRNLSRDGIEASPVYSSGTVYLLTTDGTLYALNADDGSTDWSSNLGGSDPTSPVLYRGSLYLSTSDSLFSISSGDGSKDWSYSLGTSSGMTPSVDDSGVYFADAGYVYRLRRWNGSEAWSTYIGGSLNSVVLDGERVYVASGSVGSYSKRSGDERWSTGVRGSVVGRPALYDGVLYLATDTGNLQAVDTDGSGIWTTELGREALGSPCVVNGTVYSVFTEGFSSDSTVLNAVDATEGERTSRYDIGSAATSGPVVADGTVYVGAGSGMYALSEDRPIPPSASFTVSPEEPSSDETVTLNASPSSAGDAGLERYDWTFETDGDTEEATGQTVERSFPEGSWSIRLRVLDEGGLSDTASRTVQVAADETRDVNTTEPDDDRDGTDDQASGGETSGSAVAIALSSVAGLGGLLLLNRYLRGDSDEDEILDRYDRED